MRITTWNCCKGAYAEKLAQLDQLAPEVAVIQECANPGVESSSIHWTGDISSQGLLVTVKAPFSISPIQPIEGVPKFLVPLQVFGPLAFTLLAVWAKHDHDFPYIEGVVKGVQMYRKLFQEAPVVLIGDLNSSAIWDKEHSADRNHTALVGLLDELGLVSAYHSIRGESHGKETEHTYFHHWKQAKPFHIDYCFIPKQWCRGATVEIGSFDDWKDFSDHRPLTVQLSLS